MKMFKKGIHTKARHFGQVSYIRQTKNATLPKELKLKTPRFVKLFSNKKVRKAVYDWFNHYTQVNCVLASIWAIVNCFAHGICSWDSIFLFWLFPFFVALGISFVDVYIVTPLANFYATFN